MSTVTETRPVYVHHNLTPAQRFASAVATLGNSPNAVAQTLWDLGIRGKAGCARECAVANWMTDVLGLRNVAVCGDELSGDLDAEHHTERVVLRQQPPPAVAGFIAGFGARQYLDLVEGGSCTCAEVA